MFALNIVVKDIFLKAIMLLYLSTILFYAQFIVISNLIYSP